MIYQKNRTLLKTLIFNNAAKKTSISIITIPRSTGRNIIFQTGHAFRSGGHEKPQRTFLVNGIIYLQSMYVMNNIAFRETTPCTLAEIYKRFDTSGSSLSANVSEQTAVPVFRSSCPYNGDHH
jgi:hypothetical protein